MNRSHPLAFLALVVGILPAFAQVDPLATVPGFTPAFTLTESITDSIKTTTIPGFEGEPATVMREVVTSDTSTVSITANITGIDLASIGPDTPFEVVVGALTVSGTLGGDPTYTDANKATKRSIFIPGRHHPETGAVVGTSGVKLSWTATRLTVSISRSLLDDADPGSAAAMPFAGIPEPGTTAPIKELIPVTVSFADLQSAPRHSFIKGTTAVRKQTFGSELAGNYEEHFLNTVSITGAFDTAVPTVTITAPANNSSPGGSFTITGKASDGHGIETIEYATDPATTEPWIPITNITDLPPLLGEALWGTTNKQWTFSLTGQPFGTNKFWVRTVDTSGNRSTYATVALINPMPALLTGRWDGLVTPTPTGRQGYLTLTCDVKGALSGKLTLEGTAAVLPVVGTWSGDSINAKVMNGTKTEFLLTGMVNSTSPANASAALLSFNLAKPAAVVTDPPVPTGNGTAFRCPFSATNKLPNKAPTIAPVIGRFNLSIAPVNGTTSPSGCGYFSMVVTDTGTVTVAGKTADGSTLTMSPVLGAGGQVPVFVPLYTNKGSFSVLEVIDMTLGTVADAAAAWNRPASFTDKQFQAGFSVTPMMHGERYVAPAANVRVLGLIAASPNASAEWIGDAAPVLQTQAVEVSKTNTVAAIGGNAAFKATITSATGIITGSFTLPGSTVAVPWTALIVGNQADGHYIALPVAPSVLKRHGKISFSGDVPTLAGSDDFNDNSKDLSKWRGTDIAYGGGTLTEVNGRLEFIVKSAVAETQVLRPWMRNFGSLYQEFEAIVDVHNAITPPPPLTGPVVQPNASLGLLIYNSADTADNIYVELYRGSDGFYFLSALTVNDEETGDDASAVQASADGSVRLLYNPTTRVITTFYDADGALNGYSWTPLGSFGIAGTGGTTANASWSLSGDPVLGITVGGYDEKMIITSGQVHADNFQSNTTAAP
ncbi:MAG: Ig-like domain-containing protein [Prosthecobacter sp.]